VRESDAGSATYTRARRLRATVDLEVDSGYFDPGYFDVAVGFVPGVRE